MTSRMLLAIALALAASTARAQAPPPATTTALDPARAADAKALSALVTTFERAFEAGDAKALAAMFTDDAQISDDAGSTRGGANIEARFAAYFAEHPKAKLTVRIDDLRFLTPDVAIEDGHAIVLPAGPGVPEKTRYTVVYVKQNGNWLQSSLREEDDEGVTVPERLKELEWLIGEWVNESQDAVVLSTCQWSDDKHYLLRDFTVSVAGKPALKGTQRIGWDAEKKQVRSWVFDSDGGFNEGYWSRLGDQWMVKAHGFHRDGQPVTATMMITRLGPGALRWSAFDRTRGSDLIPIVDEYTLVRRPPMAK
ncbi:MAG TPA: SgcJ/EcaC family oxidoreductase [Isosphaeraceae bacterium]